MSVEKSHDEDLLQEAASRAVLQKSLTRPLGSVMLTRIYSVPSGWETKELKQMKSLAVITSEGEFQTALHSADQDQLLVLKESGLSLDALTNLLETQSLAKTIFFEE